MEYKLDWRAVALTTAVATACTGGGFSSSQQSGVDQRGDAGSGGQAGSSEAGSTSISTGGKPATGGAPSGGGTGNVATSGGSAGVSGGGGTAGSVVGGSGGDPGGGGAAGSGVSGGSGGGTGGSGTAGSGVGGGSACAFEQEILCGGAAPWFPEFEKGCTTDDNCVLAVHTTDCCGGQAYVGINHGVAACFAEAEGICMAQYPACGCAAFSVTVEDGSEVPWDLVDNIVVECQQGTCRSRWGGTSFTCGTATCIDGQYCSTLIAGPAGVPPSYSCQQLPGGCSDCSCVDYTGCTCASDGGNVVVTCAAP